MKSIWNKYKPVILYILFGLLTTAVNMAAYALCYRGMGIPNVVSTGIAWVLAVAVAFVTNKIWVFGSRKYDRQTLAREIPAFFGARIATGVLDLGIMYLAVDVLQGNATVWKMVSNVIVIVLNYVASKMVIFRKRDTE